MIYAMNQRKGVKYGRGVKYGITLGVKCLMNVIILTKRSIHIYCFNTTLYYSEIRGQGI